MIETSRQDRPELPPRGPELAPKPAWLIDRELRLAAVPLDRRTHPSAWYTTETVFPSGDELVALFWDAKVPGSGAPEIPYVEMVQAMGNKGYDVVEAERLLPLGLDLARSGRRDELRALTAELLAAIHGARADPAHPYWSYRHPRLWEEVRAAMPASGDERARPVPGDLEERIHAGWTGQLAGGAFGTAIEGYHTEQIEKVYGRIDSYIAAPETVNDDVVYELVFLDVFERLGRRAMDSRELGLEWLRQIPFGWSAEWIALHNLADGILPPESGSWRNPYSNWIGAQMRGMVCGLLSPGRPLEAARLAHLDGVVSHAENGVYGDIYAAVLSSLAFAAREPRELAAEAARFVPAESEYASVLDECFRTVKGHESAEAAWKVLDKRFERYNWIHAYPNIAAVILALWYGGGDFTESFRILAHAGLDVDCNAGLVGTVLGVMGGVPEKWSAPLGGVLETYIRGKEKIAIRELAARTSRLTRAEQP
ncbi:MAG: ADP-ribosylglycohydrolase family protein [Treponema sp.]|nr:ADP-ribosylglycohydrolase family protein [Treponema sp.]